MRKSEAETKLILSCPLACPKEQQVPPLPPLVPQKRVQVLQEAAVLLVWVVATLWTLTVPQRVPWLRGSVYWLSLKRVCAGLQKLWGADCKDAMVRNPNADTTTKQTGSMHTRNVVPPESKKSFDKIPQTTTPCLHMLQSFGGHLLFRVLLIISKHAKINMDVACSWWEKSPWRSSPNILEGGRSDRPNRGQLAAGGKENNFGCHKTGLVAWAS